MASQATFNGMTNPSFVPKEVKKLAATPQYDGTLAEDYVSASDFCYKVPDSIFMEEAAMVEPVSVACAVCTTVDLMACQTVLVLSCGLIGVLCPAVAKQ